MSTTRTTGTAAVKREGWGSLRKLPSGRWQARYPAPDGEIYTARTDDDKPLTFLTKTDARTWLAGVHTTIARQEWEAPSTLAARRRAEAAGRRRGPSDSPSTRKAPWRGLGNTSPDLAQQQVAIVRQASSAGRQ